MKNGLVIFLLSLLLMFLPEIYKGFGRGTEVANAKKKAEITKTIELIGDETIMGPRPVKYSTLFTDEEIRRINIDAFLKRLAKKESSNNWKIINRYGYIGKYQFGGAALKSLGVHDRINYRSFKRNPWVFPPQLQDTLAIQLMYQNKKYLNEYLEIYRDKRINGILINDASVLAAAHLVGMGNMKKFFESGGTYIAKDGNRVTAEDYMKAFEDIDFIL